MAFAIMQEVRGFKKFKQKDLYMHVYFSFRVRTGEESSIKTAMGFTVPTISSVQFLASSFRHD